MTINHFLVFRVARARTLVREKENVKINIVARMRGVRSGVGMKYILILKKCVRKILENWKIKCEHYVLQLFISLIEIINCFFHLICALVCYRFVMKLQWLCHTSSAKREWVSFPPLRSVLTFNIRMFMVVLHISYLRNFQWCFIVLFVSEYIVKWEKNIGDDNFQVFQVCRSFTQHYSMKSRAFHCYW